MAVEEVAVILRNDLGTDPALVAYLTIDEKEKQPLEEKKPNDLIRELRQLGRNQLPDYMRPSRFVLLDEMPHTHERKLDRAALPLPSDDLEETSEEYIAPESGTQEVLAVIWRELLKIQGVGISDSVCDLGGRFIMAANRFCRI